MKNSGILKVNEIFYSLQGEGAMTGTPAVFVRLSGCNKFCSFCDTRHEEGTEMGILDMLGMIKTTYCDSNWIIFTGGEPLLQLDFFTIDSSHLAGYKVALETNGSLPIPSGCFFDYITVSPKVSPSELKRNFPYGVSEIRYAIAHGQTPPPLHLLPDAGNYFVSPIFSKKRMVQRNVNWCVDFCKKNPEWRLSIQSHKLLNFE